MLDNHSSSIIVVSVPLLRPDLDTDHLAQCVDQGEHHLPRGLQHLVHVPGPVHRALIDVGHNVPRPEPSLVRRGVLNNSAITTIKVKCCFKKDEVL